MNEQIRKAIAVRVEQGLSYEQIEQGFLDAGYTKEDFAEYFEEVTGGTVLSHKREVHPKTWLWVVLGVLIVGILVSTAAYIFFVSLNELPEVPEVTGAMEMIGIEDDTVSIEPRLEPQTDSAQGNWPQPILAGSFFGPIEIPPVSAVTNTYKAPNLTAADRFTLAVADVENRAAGIDATGGSFEGFCDDPAHAAARYFFLGVCADTADGFMMVMVPPAGQELGDTGVALLGCIDREKFMFIPDNGNAQAYSWQCEDVRG